LHRAGVTYLPGVEFKENAMSDDKANRGNPDRQRIDVNDPNELRDWSESIGVTPDELKSAVRQVGPVAEKVREYLRRM
jgi:hypothetical protein